MRKGIDSCHSPHGIVTSSGWTRERYVQHPYCLRLCFNSGNLTFALPNIPGMCEYTAMGSARELHSHWSDPKYIALDVQYELFDAYKVKSQYSCSDAESLRRGEKYFERRFEAKSESVVAGRYEACDRRLKRRISDREHHVRNRIRGPTTLRLILL